MLGIHFLVRSIPMLFVINGTTALKQFCYSLNHIDCGMIPLKTWMCWNYNKENGYGWILFIRATLKLPWLRHSCLLRLAMCQSILVSSESTWCSTESSTPWRDGNSYCSCCLTQQRSFCLEEYSWIFWLTQLSKLPPL